MPSTGVDGAERVSLLREGTLRVPLLGSTAVNSSSSAGRTRSRIEDMNGDALPLQHPPFGTVLARGRK